MKKILVSKKKGKYYSKDIMMLEPKNMKPLANPRSMDIINLISKEPMYPAEIAKKLRIYPQKVYYYINQLKKIGVVEVKKEKYINGANAKFYGLKCNAFGTEIENNDKEISELRIMDGKMINFFKPIIKGHNFNGRIVVGAPTSHGPFNSFARDGHYSAYLGLFLGQFVRLPKNFVVSLDIDTKSEKMYKDNMIVIGGPGVNVISYDLNKKLPYFFNIQSSKYGFLMGGIVSKKTREVYNNETIGIIQKIKNPWNAKSSIIYIAGMKAIGTKACILGITRFYKNILKTYENQDEWGVLLKGFDKDGDGKIDFVEVIEN